MTHHTLLQSNEWGNIQTAEGRHVFYIDGCMLIKHNLPFGKSWLYTPSLSPTLTEQNLCSIIDKLENYKNVKGCIFWKVEGVPYLIDSRLRGSDIVEASPLQYPETIILDLTPSEEELLKNMKQKTRYNIRLAEKKDVATKWSTDIKDIDAFYSLLQNTAQRQSIGLHTKEHYKIMLEELGPKNHAAIIFAYYKDKPIAANFVTFYGTTATYLHGGTDTEFKNLMAPYLLQWESIKEAKKRGLHHYDLGGVAVTIGNTEKWAGITRFKQGFGGELKQLGHTYDIPLSPFWYRVYKTVKHSLNVL